MNVCRIDENVEVQERSKSGVAKAHRPGRGTLQRAGVNAGCGKGPEKRRELGQAENPLKAVAELPPSIP